jgi:uncharacterized protein (TIGR02301 family)
MMSMRTPLLMAALAGGAALMLALAAADAMAQSPFFFFQRQQPQFEPQPAPQQLRPPKKKKVSLPPQQKPEAQKIQEAKVDAQPEKDEPPPPYEKDLLRLSEIMGSLAFLRSLCEQGDQGEWRTRMTALIDAEAATRARKERLAGAYNKGFRNYSTTYRRCTPSANLAIERYLAEGGRLARAISGRFGG